MNHVIRKYGDGSYVYLVCHTDGDPDDLFWVWELSALDIEDWYTYRYGVEDFTMEDAEIFVNDEDILEDSDEYSNGKAPIYGYWYAPLTMEQIERSF